MPAGYVLTIAVPAKTSEDIPWLRGYDYGGIGAIVNYMFIMAYDWHHSGSEPGTVASAISNQDAIKTAMSYQSPIQYSDEYKSPFFLI